MRYAAKNGSPHTRSLQRRGRKSRNIATEIRQKNKHKISHGRTRKNTEIRTSESRSICHGLTRNFTEKTEAEERTSRSICHGLTRNYTEISRLNKRGQVSFSALNIIYYWFRLAAEKETWPLLFNLLISV